METLLADLLYAPALQGALVAASALVSEDATALASGALVAGEHMAFVTAVLGLAFGIAMGDSCVFAMGRWAGRRVDGGAWMETPRLARAAAFFDRHGPWVILAARCVPGTRLPTYVAAGALRTRWSTFLAVSVPAAFAWSFLLMLGLRHLGRALQPYTRGVQWLVAAAALMLVVNLALARRARRRAASSPAVSG